MNSGGPTTPAWSSFFMAANVVAPVQSRRQPQGRSLSSSERMTRWPAPARLWLIPHRTCSSLIERRLATSPVPQLDLPLPELRCRRSQPVQPSALLLQPGRAEGRQRKQFHRLVYQLRVISQDRPDPRDVVPHLRIGRLRQLLLQSEQRPYEGTALPSYFPQRPPLLHRPDDNLCPCLQGDALPSDPA